MFVAFFKAQSRPIPFSTSVKPRLLRADLHTYELVWLEASGLNFSIHEQYSQTTCLAIPSCHLYDTCYECRQERADRWQETRYKILSFCWSARNTSLPFFSLARFVLSFFILTIFNFFALLLGSLVLTNREVRKDEDGVVVGEAMTDVQICRRIRDWIFDFG